jgi:hypothetical protein
MKACQETWVMMQAIDFFNRLFVYGVSREEKRAMAEFMECEIRDLRGVFYPAPEEGKDEHEIQVG